jgi:hypothetical protein
MLVISPRVNEPTSDSYLGELTSPGDVRHVEFNKKV